MTRGLFIARHGFTGRPEKERTAVRQGEHPDRNCVMFLMGRVDVTTSMRRSAGPARFRAGAQEKISGGAGKFFRVLRLTAAACHACGDNRDPSNQRWGGGCSSFLVRHFLVTSSAGTPIAPMQTSTCVPVLRRGTGRNIVMAGKDQDTWLR
jgi:hypothetical protein